MSREGHEVGSVNKLTVGVCHAKEKHVDECHEKFVKT